VAQKSEEFQAVQLYMQGMGNKGQELTQEMTYLSALK
jgi:hypothetical protein